MCDRPDHSELFKLYESILQYRLQLYNGCRINHTYIWYGYNVNNNNFPFMVNIY